MTQSQLDAVVARSGHDRFRFLTSDANPDAGQRDAYRRLVAQLADPSRTPDGPAPLFHHGGNPQQPPDRHPHASGGCCPPEPTFPE